MQAISEAQMRRRVVVSSTIGNALEWFDFTVFGLFAAVVATLFFPSNDPSTSLLQVFATFGIAFAARPLGGLVFGLYADKHGLRVLWPDNGDSAERPTKVLDDLEADDASADWRPSYGAAVSRRRAWETY